MGLPIITIGERAGLDGLDSLLGKWCVRVFADDVIPFNAKWDGTDWRNEDEGTVALFLAWNDKTADYDIPKAVPVASIRVLEVI